MQNTTVEAFSVEHADKYKPVDPKTLNRVSGVFDSIKPFEGVAKAGRTFNFVGALLPEDLTKVSKGAENVFTKERNLFPWSPEVVNVSKSGKRITRRPQVEDGEEFAEWYSALRSIELARDSYLMVSLGVNYGAPIVNAFKLLERYKPMRAHFIGIEAADNTCEICLKHFEENNLDSKFFTLIRAIISDDNRPKPFIVCVESSTMNRMLYDNEIDALIDRIKESNLGQEVANGLITGKSSMVIPFPAFKMEGVKANLKMISSVTVEDVVGPHHRVDYLEVDIQGGEYSALPGSIGLLNERVAWIHLGTHEGESKHKSIRQMFIDHGWDIHIDWSPDSIYYAPGGRFETTDGVLAMQNPRLT